MQKKANYQFCDTMLKTYFNQIKDFPLLTFEDELELSKQIQEGNPGSLHKLINSNLRLVIKIAGSFNVPDIPLLDIIQEGNIGLIQAAKKFDYRKKVRFYIYANWWIRQFINRFISNKRRMIHLPLKKEEAFKRIQRAYHVLSQTLTRQPVNSDIAKELGFSVQYVDLIVNLASDSLSFEQNVNDTENASAIDIHEDYTYSPERALMKQCSHDGTLRILNKLKDQERHVIFYRYQLDGGGKNTLKKIGDKLGISPETVRQIEKRALKKIRPHANELRECLCV